MGKVIERFHKEISCVSQCLGPCSAAFWGCTILIIGAAFVGLAFVGPIITNQQLQKGIRENIVWQPNSPEEVYNKFSGRSASQIGHMKFYFWNITNEKEILNGSKPIVQQIGPFCYNKYVITHNELFDLEGNVHFNPYIHFSEQLYNPGCVDHNLKITTPNLALLGILNGLQGMPIPGWTKDIISGIIESMDKSLFIQKTVKELLWGYTDPVLAEIERRFGALYPSLKGLQHVELVHNMSSVEEALNKPQDIMNTGLLNISNVMQYIKWDNATEITSWNNTAEQIRGTNAYQFQPNLTKNSTLTVWTADLYRVANFEYLETVNFQGIELYRFIPSKELFEINPKYDQNIYGLVNITGPKAAGPLGNPKQTPGPQILVSYPNFCNVDPSVVDLVEGIECTDSAHQLYLDVEPTLGTTMHAQIRLQMNTHIIPKWTFDKKVQEAIVPVFWTEQIGHAEDFQISEFKKGVLFAFSLLDWFKRSFILGIVVGSFSVIFFVWMLYGNYVCCCQRQKKKRRKRTSSSSSQKGLLNQSLLSSDADVEADVLDLQTKIFYQNQHVRKSSVQPQTPSESEEERVSHLE